MKARMKKLKNTNAKKSLNMNTVTLSFYNINDERLYDDIVEEVDLTAAFLGFLKAFYTYHIFKNVLSKNARKKIDFDIL